MPDLAASYREYLFATIGRMEKTGFNAHQLAIYRQMLEALDAAGGDYDRYNRLVEEKNLNFKLATAVSLDLYSAKLRQAKEDAQHPEDEIYAAMLDGIAAAADQEGVTRAIETHMEKVSEAGQKRSAMQFGMGNIVHGLLEYLGASPLLDQERPISTVRNGIEHIRKHGGDPEVVYRDPQFRAQYALRQTLWDAMDGAYDDIKAGRAKPKETAQADLDAVYRKSVDALKQPGMQEKMHAYAMSLDAFQERERSTWVAWSTQQGYDFELVWKKGGA